MNVLNEMPVVKMMIECAGIGIVIVIFLIIIKLIEKSTEKILGTDEQKQEEKETDQEEGAAESTEEFPYIKTYLLTKNEWAFYKAIKPIVAKYKLHIIAKVRIADLVSVKPGLNRKAYFNAFRKISCKHFDFLLCNPANMAVKAAIELDDSSHDKIDRQQRDYFVNKLCETVKLPLIRVTDSNDFEEKMCAALKIQQK